MAEQERQVRYAVLNIVATPHPSGVYEKLIQSAAKIAVNFWGDQFASITRPEQRQDGLMVGRLVMWTKIDESEPAVRIDDLSEVPFEELNLDLPKNIGFNGRIFLWVFSPAKHQMVIELTSEFGRTLSPQRAAKFFTKLLSPQVLGVDSPLVEVTVVPEDDSLDLVLAIPKLKKISIHLLRPNPDGVDDDTLRILTRLETMGAKSQVTELTSHAGENLELDQELLAEARVAATNGYVESRGYEDGESIHRSTKHYPKIITRVSDALVSGLAAAIAAAKETFGREE